MIVFRGSLFHLPLHIYPRGMVCLMPHCRHDSGIGTFMKDSLFSVGSRFPSGESGNNILPLIGFRMRNSNFFSFR